MKNIVLRSSQRRCFHPMHPSPKLSAVSLSCFLDSSDLASEFAAMMLVILRGGAGGGCGGWEDELVCGAWGVGMCEVVASNIMPACRPMPGVAGQGSKAVALSALGAMR